MARWKLLNAHYLSVPGTEYEYREIGNTGKQKKQVVAVPLYLCPDDANDCNYPATRTEAACIVVCHEGKGLEADIVFVGPPTPDMEPLDAEARELSAGVMATCVNPMDTAYTGDFGAQLVEMLSKQLAGAQLGKPPEASPSELQALQGQNAALAAQLAALQEAGAGRRV